MKPMFAFLFLVFSTFSFGQGDCTFSLQYRIAAESGMKMRSQPQAGTPVVTYVMHDSIVTACATTFGAGTFEDIDGYWRKVYYKGKVGYMFDGFLEAIGKPEIDTTRSIIDSNSVDSSIAVTEAIDTALRVNESSIDSNTVPSPPTEPVFVWERTERDDIPSTGRLDQKQITGLATALRGKDLRMDSLIGFLHRLPTKGSQDSVIAWIDAGMPGDIQSTSPSTVPTNNPVVATKTEVGPPPLAMQIATEAFNYCGEIGQIDPSMNWYGIFPDEVRGGYYLKRVRLEILLSQTKLGSGMEFDIRNNRDAVSHFMFGINRAVDTTKAYQLNVDRFLVSSAQLFPGQQIMTYAYNNRPSAANVYLSATGRVVEVGACPVIEDYALKINTQGPRDQIVQDITPLFSTLGECGMPDIYWFGDLNGDNYPELIFVSAEENKNEFTLLMTNTELETELYELGATWTLKKCE